VFTGIVTELGEVVAVEPLERGSRLWLHAPDAAASARLGDSIAIDGCCLTVADRDGDRIAFDAVAETLRRTALGDVAAGATVHVEPAVRAGQPMGGHWVQGHVDGVGEVVAAEREGEALNVRFAAPEDVLRYVVEKGSISVAGVSLTVTAIDETTFSVSLVPHTLAVTKLGGLAPGSRVNLEADILAKYVERLLKSDPLVASSGPWAPPR
jgi:riboflavin synthase